MGKLWGGRFEGPTDEMMEQLNDSLRFDKRMFEADIRGSQAYARAIAGIDLLTEDERDAIVDGLEQVLSEFDKGTFEFVPSDEDIHTAVERRLTELVGPAAGKLHTGRSRNDQVATDVRLYLLQQIELLEQWLTSIQKHLPMEGQSLKWFPMSRSQG